MADAGKVAIATLVMRNKEYLVAIRPEEDALALHTMYFADEVRSADRDLELPDTGDVSDRELSMAQLLIESMESQWDPAHYHDTYREKVEALVEEKRSGHEIVVQAGPEPPAKVVDLMDALNASIAAAARPGAKSPSERPQPSGRRGARHPAKKAQKPTKQPARAKSPARRRLPERLRGRPRRGVRSDPRPCGIHCADVSKGGRNPTPQSDLIRFSVPNRGSMV